jgi:hypothetical protein
MHFIMRYALNYISLQQVCYRVRVTGRVKKPERVRVWVRTCNRMRVWVFLSGRVRVGGCGYGMALPDGFLPVAISRPG